MIKANKALGQHFLNDFSIIDAFLALLQPSMSDHLVEIGPGPGILTRALTETCHRLDLIEFDERMIGPLQRQFCAPHIYIHHQDALKVDWPTLMTVQQPMRVLGNLPYQISTPLLFALLNHRECVQDMLFMLQKEVVDRIVAEPNTGEYGRLSVMLQAYFHVHKDIEITPDSFDPPPKVMSALVYLKPNDRSVDPLIFSQLQRITQAAFQQRRKTLRNSLKPWREQLDSCHIDPQLRAENVTIDQYWSLAQVMQQEA